MRLQAWHAIVLLVVILLVFGASRLPDITRNVGRSMKIFKEEVKDLRDDNDSGGSSSTTDSAANTSGSATQREVTGPGDGAGGAETTKP
ncbi:MAG: Sec-independent protein translocase subunit TatA [Beutenbergiaceae bacterium]